MGQLQVQALVLGLLGFLMGWVVGLVQGRQPERDQLQVLKQVWEQHRVLVAEMDQELAQGRLRVSELEMALDWERAQGMGRS